MKELLKELPEDSDGSRVFREWTYDEGPCNMRWNRDTSRNPKYVMQTVTEIYKHRGGLHEHYSDQASLRRATLGTQHVPPKWDHGRRVDHESGE